MSLYDQWKTASPYDDMPDPIEEGERFVKQFKEKTDQDSVYAVTVVESLLGLIADEI